MANVSYSYDYYENSISSNVVYHECTRKISDIKKNLKRFIIRFVMTNKHFILFCILLLFLASRYVHFNLNKCLVLSFTISAKQYVFVASYSSIKSIHFLFDYTTDWLLDAQTGTMLNVR